MEMMNAQITLPADFDAAIDSKIRAAVTEVLQQMQPQRADLPTYYNLGDAAKAASCARNTLSKWIDLGLPVVMIDGARRIKRTDLEAFMDSKKFK